MSPWTVATTLSVVLTVTTPALAEQYLCTPDKATGFYYNQTIKEWEITKLKSFQFVISPSKQPGIAYEVKDMSSDHQTGTYCPKGFSYGMLFCDVAWGGTISVNQTNGRFVRSFTGAYWDVGISNMGMTDENTGMLMIEIGKCTAF